MKSVVKILFLGSLMLLASVAQAVEIKHARFEVGDTENGGFVVLRLKVQESTDPRTQEFSLDHSDCLGKPAPVGRCVVKLRDHYGNYRYGQPITRDIKLPLKPLGLNVPAYSRTNIEIVANNESSATFQFPVFNDPPGFKLHRLRLMQTKYPESAQGFSGLTMHDRIQNYIFGITGFFGQGFGISRSIVAYDNSQNVVAWRADLASGSSIKFIAASPYENVLVAGGRFSLTGDSNLHLIDANTGDIIRKMQGVEDVDVSSSFWVGSQVLVSHVSLTDRQVSDTTIIDRGFLKGMITWHDVETGRLLASMVSPLFEAKVVEQSSDGQLVAFAGYEGAAVIDSNKQEVVFSLHFSDIYGPEYSDCSNYGCGPNLTGFSHFDISADKRIFAISTVSGPVFIGDAQEKKIALEIAPKTPDGKKIYIRKIKIDPLEYKMYLYGAEEFIKPSVAWVLVYNLIDGTVERAFQAGEVPGASGGNQKGSIFSKDFKLLITADSADGIADSRMLRAAQFRVFELEGVSHRL